MAKAPDTCRALEKRIVNILHLKPLPAMWILVLCWLNRINKQETKRRSINLLVTKYRVNLKA